MIGSLHFGFSIVDFGLPNQGCRRLRIARAVVTIIVSAGDGRRFTRMIVLWRSKIENPKSKMDEIRVHTQPLIDLLPEPLRPYGLVILAAVALLLVLAVVLTLRGLVRSLFRRRRPSAEDTEQELHENLLRYAPPVGPPADPQLTVYHLPVRLRLVVLAPAGTEMDLDAKATARLLDLVLPGLGEVARYDRPRVRVWPGQLSHHGFAATFFRRTRTPEREGQPSHWVLVAGRALLGRKSVLVGLALWAEQPSTVGRIGLEPHQWLDVLRLKSVS
jgi:hypothetical protein